MAEVHFNLGASADISTSGDVSDAAKSIRSHFDKRFRAAGRVATRIVLANQTTRSAIPFGGVTGYPIFAAGTDTPAVGRYWSIRSYAFVLVSNPMAIADIAGGGNALLCVGNPTNPGVADITALVVPRVDPTNPTNVSVPAADTFNVNGIVVPHGMTPFLMLPNTYDPSVQVSCQFRVEEYMEQSFLETHL